MAANWVDWVIVPALGGIVGTSELVSRYRDAAGRALRSIPALFYIAINIAASLAALVIVHHYETLFPSHLTRVLLAGVGAMAFFRTSLFVVRAGDRDVAVGPSGFLQIFLSAADREVDRLRAKARSQSVGDIMRTKNIDYAKAVLALPPYCLALMQNLAPEDQVGLDRALKALSGSAADASVKVHLLGLELINAVGKDVLEAAVAALEDQIKAPDPIP